MVAIPGEVGLPGDTDADIVRYVMGCVGGTAVVAVGFVVTGADHVWLHGGDRGHLVVEVVENRLVDVESLGGGRVA